MSSSSVCWLSLDGGGIRGLSELLIMEEIMERVKKDLNMTDDPLPADFFDVIGGTSTGGLIALLLGRLRLSVPEARKVCLAIGQEVFSIPHRGLSRAKFDGAKLEQQMKKAIQDKCGGSYEEKMLDHSKDSCKTFVCAVSSKNVGART
ncbi:phospholipase [Nemania sp. FL0916]|nr:phospholipase [Nemania sp. FL0916]